MGKSQSNDLAERHGMCESAFNVTNQQYEEKVLYGFLDYFEVHIVIVINT
jgi:hypothetical protein